MRKPEKRRISAGTVAVLLLTLVILGGTVFVWLRLSSGKTVDLSSLKPEALTLAAMVTASLERAARPSRLLSATTSWLTMLV